MPGPLIRVELPAPEADADGREGRQGPILVAFGPAPAPPQAVEPIRPRWRLALLLFCATCLSTFLVGGPIFSVSVMFVLTAHELGHYLQARRYGVPASLPYFIPMPLTPLGTMGAIIAMRAGVARMRALFDLAITGPLAGLVPALAISAAGLRLSSFGPAPEPGETLLYGSPLIFDWMAQLILGPASEDQILILHPLAFAGWVGIFITALNLLPIGQLDGGHILYTLLPRRAHAVSVATICGAIAAMAIWGLWQWTLMILLLTLFGLRHPPAAPGGPPLDRRRRLLGCLTLLFVVVGFTPRPFIF
jgi:membrane-associated protease RseP (regulator of RpoE activity)